MAREFKDTDAKAQEAQLKWATRSESRSTISNTVFLAQSEQGMPAKLESFDDDSAVFKFNAANMTVNLETGRTYVPEKEDYLTKSSPVVYDPKATCPQFRAFLADILLDADVRDYVQRMSGLSLTGFTGEHALLILFGMGQNGKSTLINILRHVLGDYATQSSWSAFTESKNGDGGGGAANPQIARLRGARFVSASESSANAILNEGTVKNITGDEDLEARFLFENSFQFRPQFKLWLSTNHKPKIVGTDPAIWRRVNLLNFSVEIPKEKQDKRLPEKLKGEASGILNWMLEGYREYKRRGLDPPQAVKVATAEYRKDNDTLDRFTDDTCDIGTNLSAQASKMYRRYRSWIRDSGERSEMTSQQFTIAMKERGFVHKRTKKFIKWAGISIRPQNEHDIPDLQEEDVCDFQPDFQPDFQQAA